MNDRAHAPAREEGRLLQAILSLAAFAAYAALLFVPAAAYYDESFFGLILSALKGSFIGNGVSRASLYVLVAAYAVMLVCTAASLFCKKKGALAFNYAKGLCMLAAFSFFTGALLYNYGLTLADVFYSPDTFFAFNATALALAVSLVYLVALSFTAFGWYGLVKLIALLIAAAFLLLGLLPFTEERTLYGMFGLPSFGEGGLAAALSAAMTVYAWGTLANFALAALSLALPRRNLLDALRADLLLVIALLAAALYAALEGFAALAACPGILVGAGLSLGQLVYANIFAFRGRQKKAAPDKEGEEDVPPPDEAPAAPGEPIGELLEAGRAELLEAERAAENARTQPAEPFRPRPDRAEPHAEPHTAAVSPLPPLPEGGETDNFLDELTSEEKAEFERLFVERSFRTDGLPAYVPGGDNRAFFRAVFAYLGAFREEISDGLLEKLDEYCEIRL